MHLAKKTFNQCAHALRDPEIQVALCLWLAVAGVCAVIANAFAAGA